MSVEIIILCVTGVVACLTYLVKHFKKSECWSKDSCCVCKMDKNDSKSDLSIDSSENKDANLKSPMDDFLPQKRDVVISSSESKENKKEYVEKEDLKVTVSSTI